MESVESRFLRYVRCNTTSAYNSASVPSTKGQSEFASMIAGEMADIGMSEVEIHPSGYVTATIPPTAEGNIPVIGFLAHIDTSPDMKGEGVNPKIFKYEGGDVVLNREKGIVMKVSDFPSLNEHIGHTIITTDGTTLLGADDKAGISEIITAAEYLIRNKHIPHGKVRIAFTCDEETGSGIDHFDPVGFGVDFAYTVDGGGEGEVEYENFNAASAIVTFSGDSIHPGYAKGKMINALTAAMEFDRLIPSGERPENTEGYEGYYHLCRLEGGVESAKAEYAVRDHDRALFERRKKVLTDAAGRLNGKYGKEVATVVVTDRYRNMKEVMDTRMEVVEIAVEAIRRAGAVPHIKPIRGGTDGSRLSFMGIPCPNLFTGGMNFHGKYEYVSVDVMRRSVETIINIISLAAEQH